MKFRDEWKWFALIAAACLVVYANSLSGSFVYDDLRQIVRNPLIQDNGLFWKALTSDVWAFKGDGTTAASNYWRPTFTLWNIINFRLFGIEPFGWHATSLVLHSGVCLMAYALLRRWAFSIMTAFVITLIFAVHPIHVESVAWVAGSPDLLFSMAFLGSLWFATSYRESRSTKHLVLTAVLYAVALGAKEIGIVCLPIYYFILSDSEKKSKPGADNMPLFALGSIAGIYFVLRWTVLGAISRPPEDAAGLGTAIMSIPEMFAFYLRQAFFPYWTGANYPLEVVNDLGATNFVIPLAVSVAALAGIYYLAKKTPKGMLASSIFLLPLITAMNATAFIPEQIVHDRYLYLPLLGLLMLIVGFLAKYIREQQLLISGAAIAAVLAFLTFTYNSAWASDLALWKWTSAIDDSSFTLMQLGSALDEAGQADESIRAYSAAIAKRPTFRGYLGRGRGYLMAKKFADAERDIKTAMAMPGESQEAYALYQAYEALGLVYSQSGNREAAIKNFDDARTKLPIYYAALSVDLAIVLYQNGQKSEALIELESAQAQAKRELLPESKAVFFRLGMLYAELGRTNDARAALQEYLRSTANMKDKNTLADRGQTTKMLGSLK